MPDIILHHYDFSPFAEKVRLILGFKGLSWRSVIIPSFMPKPDLVALTGGYRNTPVLQIGADVYCDTRIIARTLERLHPTPTLFPGGNAGMTAAVEAWAERDLFWPLVRYVSGINAERMPAELHVDRAAMLGKHSPSLPRLKAVAERSLGVVQAQIFQADAMLADGRPYLLADGPGLADIAVYHGLWFLSALPIDCSEQLRPYPNIRAWMARIAAIGHGHSIELTAHAALDAAAAASPAPLGASHPADHDLPLGTRVTIGPENYKTDAVEGELVLLDRDEVAVRRLDCPLGDVVVHFPRVGYGIAAAAA